MRGSAAPAAVLATALAVLVATPSPGRAEIDIGEAVNFAFATQVGGGIYRINGSTLQVYRITATVPLLLPEPEGRHFGLTLRLPTTLGFYGFRTEDAINLELPSTIGALAIVPELLAEIPLGDQWWLGPFVGLGPGKDFQGGDLTVIFAAGLRSQVVFPKGTYDLRLGNRLIYSAYTSDRLDFVDDFGLFETGLEWRRAVGTGLGGRELDVGLFGASYVYFLSPRLIELAPDPIEMRTEWELGFTLGTVRPWTILGLGMPRLGLSRRFGSGADAIRFVIGNAFPIDRPEERGTAIQ